MPEGWGNCQNEDSMGEEQNRFIKVKSRGNQWRLQRRSERQWRPGPGELCMLCMVGDGNSPEVLEHSNNEL